jgi:predicted ferric reductase
MINIKNTLWIYILLISLLWIPAEERLLTNLDGLFEWRPLLVQLSGILAISSMSFAMILSIRPKFLEKSLSGLDKIYRLHKWLGISALTFSIMHWLIVKAPKWLVDLGLLTRKARAARPKIAEDSLQKLFLDQSGLAKTVGEWAFYCTILLIMLALIKKFPYRKFVQTHKILTIVYLALVFHVVILLRFSYWLQPIGLIVILLLISSAIAAIMVMLKKNLGAKKVLGKIVGLKHYEISNTTAIEIKLEKGWPGHQAGQFAFLALDKKEGYHPFTIESSWQNDDYISFMIKGLGDYTNTLPNQLKLNDEVSIEGPYGRFTFMSQAPYQVWIAGGIGITPFIARLKHLAHKKDEKKIELFYSIRNYDKEFIDELIELATLAHVKLHVILTEKDGRLDVEKLLQANFDLSLADFWFCGDSSFGEDILNKLSSKKTIKQKFHQELFEMR